MQNKDDTLLQSMTLGMVGERKCGSPEWRWIDDIKEWYNIMMPGVVRIAQTDKAFDKRHCELTVGLKGPTQIKDDGWRMKKLTAKGNAVS